MCGCSLHLWMSVFLVPDGGGGLSWLHLSMIIKAQAVVTKLSPHAWLLSATSTLRELQTHYRARGGRRRKGKKEKERELEREPTGAWRPVAEGLILNVLQRQCLLSSLASPLTAPVSKQELYPPSLHSRKKGGQEMQWLLEMKTWSPWSTVWV